MVTRCASADAGSSAQADTPIATPRAFEPIVLRLVTRTLATGMPTPATATAAPATRSATCPSGHRWIVPIAMPMPCRQPVATTNPML